LGSLTCVFHWAHFSQTQIPAFNDLPGTKTEAKWLVPVEAVEKCCNLTLMLLRN
jgi:hypothetical protein